MMTFLWGVFDRDFNITEKFVLENPVYVAWDEMELAAFWGLMPDVDGSWELEYFYVAETGLRSGSGRTMWNHMTEWCGKNGVTKIHFVTSSQAVGFYEKMGALHDKTSNSTIDGRPIPHFVFEIKD